MTFFRMDPLGSFRFRVEIDGLVVGGFSEVTGLQLETEVETYREGGANAFAYKLPKTTSSPNLVLKRGMTYSDLLWRWYRGVVGGSIERRSGSVILLDEDGWEAWRWNFVGAYPVKWIGPELRGDQSQLAFETIELAHHGLLAE
ncbi:phage tail protein [Paenibacillus terricola]|nr:phage tail protein [Paenibacillus terricola]